MSYSLIDLVVKQSRAQGVDKLVLLVLAWHTNKKTGKCCPGIDTLAAECGLSRRSVLRSIDQLERSSVLQVERRPGRPNWYGVTFGDTTVPSAPVPTGHGYQCQPDTGDQCQPDTGAKDRFGTTPVPTGHKGVSGWHPNKEEQGKNKERAHQGASRERAREPQPQPVCVESEPQPENRPGIFGPDPPPFPEDLAADPRVVAWRQRWDGTNGPPLPPLPALVAEFRAWAQASRKRYVDWPRQLGVWARKMFSPCTDSERAIAGAHRAVREPDSREGKALAALVEFVGAGVVDHHEVLRHAYSCGLDHLLATNLIELHFDYRRGRRHVMNHPHVIEQASAQEAAAALERQRLH